MATAATSGNDDNIGVYEINTQSMGVVVLINNYEFHDTSKNRSGGELDSKRLQELFLKIGYQDVHVHLYENKTSKEITDILENIKTNVIKAEHSTFILCIMSHGEKNNRVMCSDGNFLHLWKFILPIFCDKSCKQLAGKPKLVITQFCRGTTHVEKVHFDASDDQKSESISEWKDLLLLQASPPYHRALRGKSGSVFIQSFCDICEKYYKSESVEDIMKRVVKNVSGEEFLVEVQTGVYEDKKIQPGIGWNSLDKQFYLTSKIQKNIQIEDIKRIQSMFQDMEIKSSYCFPETGDNSLINLCKSGDVEKIQVLLMLNADVNQSDDGGWTPLHFSAYNGHTETAELLIKQNADVNQAANYGLTSLHLAAHYGHTETAELLMKHNADVNQSTTKFGLTPLHCAALNGHTETAELLMKHNADVNQTDSNGETPLHCAARNGHTETAELLMKHNADVNTKFGVAPLHCAALNGHTETAELLMKHNADVCQTDNRGWTPLHWAARNGHTETAELLMKHNADVCQTDNRGWTPLHLAAQYGHTETAELLMKYNK